LKCRPFKTNSLGYDNAYSSFKAVTASKYFVVERFWEKEKEGKKWARRKYGLPLVPNLTKFSRKC